MLVELGETSADTAVDLNEDNQACIKLAHNPSSAQRTKPMDHGCEIPLLEASSARRKGQPEIRRYKETTSGYIHKAITRTSVRETQGSCGTEILQVRLTQSGYVV